MEKDLQDILSPLDVIEGEPARLTSVGQVGHGLAAEEKGGRVLLASDEFFAPKENLLKPGRGKFIPDKYTDRGKWMDGWETRRRRPEGHDWCIIRLGTSGVIMEIDIDTNHFVGNHPTHASVDACQVPPFTSIDDITGNKYEWVEILPRSELQGDSQNLFTVNNDDAFNHLRLNIYPDGGVARFKVYGRPEEVLGGEKDWFDAAAAENGGDTLACSDMHFGDMKNLIRSGTASDMSDGWETRRRRSPGHDWVILKLGAPCAIERIVVDTLHFKGNFPDSCSLEGCFAPNVDRDFILFDDIDWQEVLPVSKLGGNREHIFSKELKQTGPQTHIRFNIYPDGGVSRLRIFGYPITR
ncbi:MAG: allantoicase [Candidatus Marinimicrobia bacterium]|nr:allantoicase [Candidatus Neomarinimicrobiota bacterium]